MAKQGLSYCIVARTEGPAPPPAGASETDILGDFLGFCRNGIRDAQGRPIEAPHTGGKMTGTINWLASAEKFEANFYIAHKPTLMFFVSLADAGDDWKELPGFMLFVKTGDLTLHLGDGQFVSEGEFILEPRPELDKALADMKPFLDRVSATNKPRLIAALRGDKATDLKKVLDELELTEPFGLRALINSR